VEVDCNLRPEIVLSTNYLVSYFLCSIPADALRLTYSLSSPALFNTQLLCCVFSGKNYNFPVKLVYNIFKKNNM